MRIKINAINPEELQKGETTCTIRYEAKSYNTGEGRVGLELSGDNGIWFKKDDQRLKHVTLDPQTFTSEFQEFAEPLTFEVTETPNNPQIAFIKATATDAMNIPYQSIINISYE